MKTLYRRDGTPVNVTHDVDAKEAIKAGVFLPYPPGKRKPIPVEQEVGYDMMDKSDIVNIARKKHNADLDVNDKKEILVEQLNQLDATGKLEKKEPGVPPEKKKSKK